MPIPDTYSQDIQNRAKRLFDFAFRKTSRGLVSRDGQFVEDICQVSQAVLSAALVEHARSRTIPDTYNPNELAWKGWNRTGASETLA